jgi:hypothetical protein
MAETSFDPVTVLLALVPALPLLGCLVTVVQGKMLGPRAHWPAVASFRRGPMIPALRNPIKFFCGYSTYPYSRGFRGFYQVFDPGASA